ncbi:hypothetical protein ACJX0J_008503, partial [Zea mays]
MGTIVNCCHMILYNNKVGNDPGEGMEKGGNITKKGRDRGALMAGSYLSIFAYLRFVITPGTSLTEFLTASILHYYGGAVGTALFILYMKHVDRGVLKFISTQSP